MELEIPVAVFFFIHGLVEFVLVMQMDWEPVQKLFYMFQYLPILSFWGKKMQSVETKNNVL